MIMSLTKISKDRIYINSHFVSYFTDSKWHDTAMTNIHMNDGTEISVIENSKDIFNLIDNQMLSEAMAA